MDTTKMEGIVKITEGRSLKNLLVVGTGRDRIFASTLHKYSAVCAGNRHAFCRHRL